MWNEVTRMFRQFKSCWTSNGIETCNETELYNFTNQILYSWSLGSSVGVGPDQSNATGLESSAAALDNESGPGPIWGAQCGEPVLLFSAGI